METEKTSSSHVPDSVREPYSSGTRSHVPVGDIYGPGQDVIFHLVETEINSRVCYSGGRLQDHLRLIKIHPEDFSLLPHHR